MSYNGTENLHSEFSTETHFINGQFSSTGTINGVSYRETLTFQLGVQITKIFLNYTNHGINSTFVIVSTKVWLKLEHRVWITETITVAIEREFSAKGIENGDKKFYFFQIFIAKKVLILHNKDPPVVHL